MKDFLGREIRPGDIIVYGHLLGRCAGLKIGKVVKIGTVTDYANRVGNRITVAGVERSSWRNNGQPTLGRKGCLQYHDRCMVVHPNDVPADIYAILKTVQHE